MTTYEPDLLKRAELLAANLEGCAKDGLGASITSNDVAQLAADLRALVAECKLRENERLQCAGDCYELEAAVGHLRQELAKRDAPGGRQAG